MKNHIKPHSISIKNTFSAFYPPQNCHKRKPNREVGAGVREGIRPTAIDTESIACSPTKGGAQQSCGVQSTRSNRKRKPNREVGTGVREGIRTPDLRFRKPTLYPAELHERAYKFSKQSAQAEKSATAHFLFRVVYFIAINENYSPL